MTKLQELLGKILTNRITREKADETLDDDRDNLNQTLDLFLAGDKITADQYAGFTDSISPGAKTTTGDENKTS
jgi:hypothetical protein